MIIPAPSHSDRLHWHGHRWHSTWTHSWRTKWNTRLHLFFGSCTTIIPALSEGVGISWKRSDSSYVLLLHDALSEGWGNQVKNSVLYKGILTWDLQNNPYSNNMLLLYIHGIFDEIVLNPGVDMKEWSKSRRQSKEGLRPWPWSI